MDKKEFRIKKYENLFDGYILASDSGDVALFFGDDIFLGALFDATNTQIRDIALFNEFNPNHPNSYLCNKYNVWCCKYLARLYEYSYRHWCYK